MRLDQLILRNLAQHRVSSLLTLANVAFGTLLVSAVLLLRQATSDSFLAPSRGFSLVVGAPGSRLELVLNTVFHRGQSPGLLRYGVFEELEQHPSSELCVPYASVIDIDAAKLPSADAVNGWTAEQFTSALRHDQANSGFNPSLRQLLHVGFKVAAQMGDRYTDMLKQCEAAVSRNVTTNLYERHLKPLFVG